MTNEVENIILQKEYIELTPKEKALIREFAESEVDFDQVKFTLMQVHRMRTRELPKVDDSVKISLDALFDKTYTAKRLVWHNRLWLFLWPEENKYYARPLFQLATMLVLILSVVTFVPFSSNESKIAMNESVREELKMGESTPEVKEEVKEEVVDNLQEEEVKTVLLDNKSSMDLDANTGWTLADLTVTEDADYSEPVAESMTLSQASAAGSSMFSEQNAEAMMDEVVVARMTENVAKTKSVSPSSIQAISPKNHPQIFDVLTALY